MSERYMVGIDLGTTHTVVGYADLRELCNRDNTPPGGPAPEIRVFDVLQLVAPGEAEQKRMLPSFRYHVGEHELSQADTQLPWEEPLPRAPRGIIGTLAQRLGHEVPGRLVASAKSWLSHSAVDRQAPILPWGAPEGVSKISPVDASASYLAHVRAAWDKAHPGQPLHAQAVVLTVPASFDEGARALTLEAAQRAGLPKVHLLEEPQAAFYAFAYAHGARLEESLHDVRMVIVVDVGGGTTDLTLIAVEPRPSGIRLTRIAVGDHLMLGGDNMDLMLARAAEARIQAKSAKLSAAAFSQLVQRCREAKERLLADGAPDELKVTVLGTGSKVIGGAKSTVLRRSDVSKWIVDGFTPDVTDAAAPRPRQGALVEFGLPYESDPAITRHVAAFVLRHREAAAKALGHGGNAETPAAVPDAVLFNGGVFRSPRLRRRLLDVLAGLAGRPVRALENLSPELAVARGAVAFGLAKRGVGLRIGGGSARAYFVEVEGEAGEKRGVCVLPRGAEEGEDVWLQGRRFALRVGQPVRFRLWANAADRGHRPGDLVPLDGEGLVELPAIAAVLRPGEGAAHAVTVELHAALTEIGTLEVSCVDPGAAGRRYKLEFQLRGEERKAPEQAVTQVAQLHPRFEEAVALIRGYYGKSDSAFAGRKVKGLRTDLEKVLGDRQAWDTALLRELFGALLAGVRRRRRSTDHERLWFNLAGYCLRPGLGYPLDAWRVEQLWAVYDQGIQYTQDAAVWAQWWILWRRIAGGLSAAQQGRLADSVAFYLEPASGRPRPRPKGPRPLALEDMARMVGALEHLPAQRKVELGQWLLLRIERGELSKSLWWAVGRLGARAPLHGSAHTAVPAGVAEAWLARALAEDLAQEHHAALAAAQLARRTGDRARDLPEPTRAQTAKRLQDASAYGGWIALVRDGGPLSPADQHRVFGEALPAGLSIVTGAPSENADDESGA